MFSAKALLRKKLTFKLDRRRNVRHPVRVICQLRTAGQPELLHGQTCNVSRCGALIEVTNARKGASFLRLDSPVTVELLPPPHPLFGQRAFKCAGFVVRVESERFPPLIAVEFEQWL